MYLYKYMFWVCPGVRAGQDKENIENVQYVSYSARNLGPLT